MDKITPNFWHIMNRRIVLLLLFFFGIASVGEARQHEMPGSENESDAAFLHHLNDQIESWLERAVMDSARVALDRALYLAEQTDDPDARADTYFNLSTFYLYQRQPDSLLYYVEDIFPELLESSKGIQIGNLLAVAYNRSNQNVRAIELHQLLLNRAKEEGNIRYQYVIRQNMGNAFRQLGDMDAAVNSYLEALELMEGSDDRNAMMVLLDNLGNLNTEIENFELAEIYVSRALEMALSDGILTNQLTSSLNLGIIYNLTGRHEAAIELFEDVLELSLQLGSRFSEVQALYNIGEAHKNRGNFELAVGFFNNSMQKSKEYGVGLGIYYNSTGLGGVYRELGESSLAIANYEKALEVAEAFDATDLILESLQRLSEVHEVSSDTSAAFLYLKRYTAKRDTINLAERDEALARQEVLLGLRLEQETRELTEQALEAQKRNTRIILSLLGILAAAFLFLILSNYKIRKINKLLNRQSKELADLNEKRNQLLSVLSHDLRTPLSSLQSLIELLKLNTLEKGDLDSLLEKIDASIGSEIVTLGNYLEWAKSQQTGITPAPEQVELSPLIGEILETMESAKKSKGIEIRNLAENNGTSVYADIQLLRVILRNLISNAIKFTSNGGHIEISAAEADSDIVITISDSGVGMTPKEQANLFKAFVHSKQGTEGESGAGIGLSICHDFAEKQNGSLSCSSKPGEGSDFYLRLPKNAPSA